MNIDVLIAIGYIVVIVVLLYIIIKALLSD